jgi:hypothetical protein
VPYDFHRQDLSLEMEARDPVWKILNASLTSAISGPAAQVNIHLRPFLWYAEKKMVHIKNPEHTRTKVIENLNGVRTAFGMEICMPSIFCV